MLAVILAAAFIVRIVAVRDTRDVVEIDDRFVPVPGTGDARACDRCGRTHEIHVDVLLSDGRTSTLGAGCARGESTEIQSKIKSAISAAKTRTRLAAELADLRVQQAAYAVVAAEVEALPLPEVELVEEIADQHGRGPRRVYAMGDANVWTLPGCDFNAERRTALISSWRSNRIAERGKLRQVYSHTIDDLETRLAKIDRKLATLTA